MKRIVIQRIVSLVLVSLMAMSMAACCSQGIEYVLTEDFTCPEDYPEDGEIVTVTGVFDVYLEDNTMYCTLRDGKMSCP